MFGILVCFKEREYWSKSYTYKSTVPIDIGRTVVVPTASFYGAAKVVDCIKDYKFKEGVNYKEIHSVLDV